MDRQIFRRWKLLKRKKLTILAVPSDGTDTKGWAFSYATLLRLLLAAAVSAGLVISLFVSSYFQARRVSSLTMQLENRNAENALLKVRIENQKRQLHELLVRVSQMESQLVDMSDVSAEIYAVLEELGVNVEALPQLEQVAAAAADGTAAAAHPDGADDAGVVSDESTSAQGGPYLQRIDTALSTLEEIIPAQVNSLGQVKEALEEKRYRLEHTPNIWPNDGWVSSSFGRRRDPFTGKYAYHEGIDIANHQGTPIFATAAGKVTHAGYMGGYGNLVIIDHGFGIETRYGHIDRLLVKRGDEVTKGQKIATVGNTGRSTGPHVHYEVRVKGKPVSPFRYLPDR